MDTTPSVFSQISSIFAASKARIAAIAPPEGTAFCIRIPLCRTTLHASFKLMTRDATRAPYSPRLSPPLTQEVIPPSSTARRTAASAASIQICVYSVWLILSFSSKQSFAISSPDASEAVANTSLHTGNAS